MAKKAAVGKNEKSEKKEKRVKATGFAPLKFKDCMITQKNSGRFAVVDSKGKNVNGQEKAKLLLEAKVIKGSFKKEAAATESAT